MAKTSVLSRPIPRASLPRNSFDRSFRTNFVHSGGFLCPVFCEFLPAGSHAKINRSEFVRMAQVNTAAFPIIDHHIDFFKVPLRLLMTRYNEFKLAIQDVHSSSLTSGGSGNYSVPTSMPYFSSETAWNYVTDGSTLYVDPLGYQLRKNGLKLLDYLGYCDENIFQTTDGVFGGQSMNLNAFKLLAYQKVYFDHYRNTAYESNDVLAYNADVCYSDGNNGLIGNAQLLKLMTPRYVNYRKDYFQNIYPALNYVSSNPQHGTWLVPSTVVGVNTSSTFYSNNQPVLAGILNTAQLSPSVTSGASGSNYLSVSVQQLRSAFALDKLMRASAYAPKHVKQQLEARFGVKSSAANSCESEALGSFMSDITIGEVTATAETSGSGAGQLGAIGGKGVGAQSRGRDIVVDTEDDDCLILGLSYFMIRSSYDSFSLDNFNFKFSKEDLFVPEFENLGLQPIYKKEVYLKHDSIAPNAILGYVPRYQEFKLGIDKNHGEFRTEGALSSFVNHTNIKSQWIVSSSNGVTLRYFKTDPADFDAIFVDQYNDSDLSNDQFFGQISFSFISRQNMDVHGQPRL